MQSAQYSMVRGGLQISDIRTKNVREYLFNSRLGYAMVRLDI